MLQDLLQHQHLPVERIMLQDFQHLPVERILLQDFQHLPVKRKLLQDFLQPKTLDLPGLQSGMDIRARSPSSPAENEWG